MYVTERKRSRWPQFFQHLFPPTAPFQAVFNSLIVFWSLLLYCLCESSHSNGCELFAFKCSLHCLSMPPQNFSSAPSPAISKAWLIFEAFSSSLCMWISPCQSLRTIHFGIFTQPPANSTQLLLPQPVSIIQLFFKASSCIYYLQKLLQHPPLPLSKAY